MKFFNLSVLVSLLGACGGGSTGLDIPTFESALAVASASGAALERIDDLAPSTLAQVPTSGSAIYAGTLLIGDADLVPEVVGGMAIEVDFADDAEISGGAGSFFNADGSAVGGTMVLSSPTLARNASETRLTSNLQGRLTGVSVNGSEEDITYNLALGGSFLGSNADAIAGGVSGNGEVAGSEGVSQRNGTFVLEQN